MSNENAPVVTAESDPKKAKSEAYAAAVTRLREAHRDELNGYVGEEMKARGIEWKPRPTAAQKAAEEAKRLLSQHPEIAADLRELLG